jgi:hypothetical protein
MHEVLRQFRDRCNTGDDMFCPVRFFSYDPKTNRIGKVIERRNLIVYSGADVLARLLAGQPKYAPNAMYLEFKNTGGSSVPAPSYGRGLATEYYQTLASDVDFLRIPLMVTPFLSASDNNYKNNQVTYFATSQGVAGAKAISPLPFNTNSVVYGAALVAMPDLNDVSQDVVFSRVYTEIGSIQKEVGHEIGVTWTIQCD